MTIKFKGIDPQDILDRKATQSSRNLETMLAQNGFKFQRQNASSHIIYNNPDTNETIGIVAGSDNYIYTEKVAEACLRWRAFIVAKLEKEQKRLTEQSQDADGDEAFDIFFEINEAEDRTVRELLAAEKSDEHPNLVIIRFKKMPQIGFVLPALTSKAHFFAELKNASEAEKQLGELLERAIKEYEFKGHIGQKDHNMLLVHKVYDLAALLLPYDPFAEKDAAGYVREAIEHVKSYDRRYIDIAKQHIEAAEQVGTTEDGKIKWEIRGTNPLTQQTDSVRFMSTPAHRINILEVLDLFTADLNTFIMPNEDQRYLKRVLRENWGFDLTRPKGVGNLLAKHLLYPDLNFELPVFYEQPGLQAMFDYHLNKKKPANPEQFEKDMNNLITVGSHTRQIISTAIDTVIEINNMLRTRFKKADTIIRGQGQKRKVYPDPLVEGEFGYLSYTDLSGQEQCRIKVLVTTRLPKTDKNKNEVSVTPGEEELAKLENYARLVQEQSAKPANQPCLPGSFSNLDLTK